MYDWFDQYARQKPGTTGYYKSEWNWQRYLVGGKLFADAGMTEEGGTGLFLTLRCDEADLETLRRQYASVAPGFYTNKKLYLTIWFNLDAVPERDRTEGAPPVFPPDDLVRGLVDKAYEISFSKLPKGKQKKLKGSD